MKTRINAYTVLGLNQNFEAQDLTRAFRKRAQQWHPDRGGAHESFLALMRAYEILREPQLREAMASLEIFDLESFVRCHDFLGFVWDESERSDSNPSTISLYA